MRPIDEGGDDLDSGSVGLLPDPAPDAEAEDAAAVRALKLIADVLEKALAQLDGKLAALARPFRAPSARLALNQIGRATDFLDELETYITEGYRSESEARE